MISTMERVEVARDRLVGGTAGLTKAEAARRFGVSWQWVNVLIKRYRAGGIEALEPRSRRPKTNPHRTGEPVQERVIALRRELTSAGWDAGPASIDARLERDGIAAPDCRAPPTSPSPARP